MDLMRVGLDSSPHGATGLSARAVRGGAICATILAAVLITLAAVNSRHWVGTTFPGFFVMANRVIPSITLSEWEANTPDLFQHQVIAVDGAPVSSSAAIYERVRQSSRGTLIQYTLRRADGVITTQAVRSRRFSARDYVSIFGAFLVTGSAFILTALLAVYLRPGSSAGLGLFSAGLVGGVFVITAIDLYGPHWFFRLHVLAECLVPASLIHLALVFPTNRLRNGRRSWLLGVYAVCLLLAAIYETVLHSPSAYTLAHLVASTAQGVGGLSLICVIGYDLFTTGSTMVRRRVLVAALGTLAAFLVPTVLMSASGLFAGRVAVNSAALSGFLFPLSFAYAIVKRDLVKIDVLLQKGVALLIVLMTTTCFSTLAWLVSIKARLQ
jgi:hypothetical protein